jgi:mevalonate kinase
MIEFYSPGKLLITSEYAVLDGAKALALPTKYGQNLLIRHAPGDLLNWRSFDEKGHLWFSSEFSYENSKIAALKNSDDATADALGQLLNKALQLATQPPVLRGVTVETHLEFNRGWGLGSSSTLVNNMASWFQVDAYRLLKASFGGSGYDLACAQYSAPIVYKLINGLPKVQRTTITWPFKDNIYFVYLNQKQNSRSGISNYRSKNKRLPAEIIDALNAITNQLISTTRLDSFESLIEEHNSIISELIGEAPLSKTIFKDFDGAIKNLGAWGGDFILTTSRSHPGRYFKEKGFDTILSFDEMIK